VKEWWQHPKDMRGVLNLVRKDHSVEMITRFLWPVANDYYSKLNPIFLYQIHDLGLFSYAPNWLLRDGLVGLLWFFKKNPKPPPKWKSCLLVHSSLVRYVPPLWRKFVGSYRLKTQVSSCLERRCLLLTGLVTEAFCSLESLNVQIEKIAAHLDSAGKRKKKVFSFLLVKPNVLGGDECSQFVCEYLLKIQKVFGPEISPINWNQWLRLESFQEFDIVDFNDYTVCADSFLYHYALSLRGALFAESPRRQDLDFDVGEYQSLSPYHGLEVCYEIPKEKWPEYPSETFIENKKYRKIGINRSSVNEQRVFPWSRSFVNWTQTL